MVRYENELAAITKEYNRLLFDEKEWKLEKEEAECKIYSVMTPSSTKSRCFKCEFEINMQPRRVTDTIHFFGPYRCQYDPNFVSSDILEELSDNAVIGHYVGKPQILGISLTGDYVNIFVFDQKDDDYYYSLYGSINYDKPVEKATGIRGWMHPSGFAAFKTTDPNRTRAVIIWHTEFSVLPAILVRTVIEKASVSGVIQYVGKLRSMKDKPYEPLGPRVPMCKNRK